jgi:hypothetical protein
MTSASLLEEQSSRTPRSDSWLAYQWRREGITWGKGTTVRKARKREEEKHSVNRNK